MNKKIAALAILIFPGFLQATTYSITDLGAAVFCSNFAIDINKKGQVAGTLLDSANGESRAFVYGKSTLKVIGNLSVQSCANKINDKEQVVGNLVYQGTLYGFLYTDNQIQLILPPAGAFGLQAISLNNKGIVIGNYRTPDFQAFSYDGTTLVTLGTLGGRGSVVLDINDKGQIVGQAQIANGNWHPYLYQNGVMQDIDSLGGGNGEAISINKSGQVTGLIEGILYGTGYATHAFIYSDGETHDIGTLGGNYSFGKKINNKGEIMGESTTANDPLTHLFLYKDNIMLDLGAFPGFRAEPTDMNDNGQIVGAMRTPDDSKIRAFIYEDTVLKDLNDLVPANSNMTLMFAFRINEKGSIVGTGKKNGQLHSFLLVPNAPGK